MYKYNSSSRKIKMYLSLCAQFCLLATAPYYYLSLDYNVSSPVNYFIHGLWPQTDLATYPTYCKPVIFNPSDLDPILPELKMYWPSDTGDDYSFWSHEWSKHGSCVYNQITEFDYFNTTLSLFMETWGYLNDFCKYENCFMLVNNNMEFTYVGKYNESSK